ncbi:MAG: ATP-dependent sacrificial sulfur transferase LarE [Ruminococcus sp.]|nr:ATP-dependent sacrificial sulfur transferase LarE [Ruminococcus sp.]
MDELGKKKQTLEEYFRALGSTAVAFSSGVDSAFLLMTAHEALGDKALAVTASSASFPERELSEAKEFCEKNGIRQIIIEHDEMQIEGFKNNPKNRCYYCKNALFEKIKGVALENGIACVCEGSNKDDEGDYRPGLQAVAELGIKSPLRELGFTKAEIRELAHSMGLPMWDKPSFACLASRVPYGEEISEKKLSMIEKAEQKLFDLGFTQVRVRIHGDMARIEIIPEQFPLMLDGDTARLVNGYFSEIGFSYTALDLGGYKMGNMNKKIKTGVSEDK